jgi:predicted ATPase
MYIRQLKLTSLRCFESAELAFQYPGRLNAPELRAPNVNLLLGENGAGKTTVMRAAALAALAPLMSRQTGYTPYKVVRHGHQKALVQGIIQLSEQDLPPHSNSRRKSQRLEITIRRQGDNEFLEPRRDSSLTSEMLNDRSPAFLVLGYGATRRVEESSAFSASEELKRRALRYQRVAGLFEPQISLVPLTAWLPRMRTTNRGRHNQVVHLIDRLLPEDADFEGKQEREPDGPYVFRMRGVEVPFGALSDGYRAYIGWIADLLYHVCMGAPKGAKLVDNRGLVLVDEIDLNLHPEWQRTVIPTLSRTLPNLQFIFSTHSPIVAGSLQKENIFVMEVDEKGTSEVKQYDENIYGLDAQQVLLSSYFGLDSTRTPEAVDEIRSLSRQLRPGRSDIALQIMRKLTGEDQTSLPAKPRSNTPKAKRPEPSLA